MRLTFCFFLQVGRLVVVVIDALRADFVLDQKDGGGRPKISWLTEALESGDGRAWVARASPPTVTLPRFQPILSLTPQVPTHPTPSFLFTCHCRIKALTTGRISSFADVVRNANPLVRGRWLDRNPSVFLAFGQKGSACLYDIHRHLSQVRNIASEKLEGDSIIKRWGSSNR